MLKSEFIQQLSQKRIIIIGPPGAGKSRTGNYLSGKNNFRIGQKSTRVTTELKIKSHENGLMICDMPGLKVLL